VRPRLTATWTCWSNTSLRPDWSLLDTARLRAELAELFGRPVDLVRERNVTNPYRLASIRRDRRQLYAS
jgi:predicted nucleotidyltransferase